MKLADSHIHLFKHGFPGRYGSLFPAGDLSVYEKIREVHDVERALVVGYEGEPWARGNNRYIVRLAKTHSWITPLAFCEPTALSSKTLKRLWRQGFAGVSLYIFKKEDAGALNCLSPETIDALNEHYAIISLNCPADIAGLMRPFFARLAGTRLLISHLGIPEKMTGAARQLHPVLKLADLPHLGLKISGAYALNAYPHPGLPALLSTLKTAFGESRLYWGSDFCPALDNVSFAQTIDLGLPAGLLSQDICAGNLNRIIKRVKSWST